MTQIIGVVQAKGGVGRSTIATNLAAIASLSGTVCLIDCDLPQATSSSWFAQRQQDLASPHLSLRRCASHLQLIDQIKALIPRTATIIIDGPPRISEMTRAILMLSDLCLLPLGASAAEVWATGDILTVIREAREYKKKIDARIVWNRFRPQTRTAQEMHDAVQSEFNLPELQTRLGYRVAYSEALARGLSVDEWLDRAAHGEIVALAAEIAKILKEKRR
jgi:chromosome partitioning protein